MDRAVREARALTESCVYDDLDTQYTTHSQLVETSQSTAANMLDAVRADADSFLRSLGLEGVTIPAPDEAFSPPGEDTDDDPDVDASGIRSRDSTTAAAYQRAVEHWQSRLQSRVMALSLSLMRK